MKTFFSIGLLLLVFQSAVCQTGFHITDTLLYAKAKTLTNKFTVVDSHNDLPLWLYNNWFDISVSTGKDMDYVSASEGGMDVVFLAVFTWAGLEGTGKAKPQADSLIKIINKITTEWPENFSVVKSSPDVENNLDKEKILLAIGMENGSPLENNIENVKEYYEKGVRYITLCHTRKNHISDSANDPDREWNGLSPFGEEVVKEMNRLGMMVDVSHISDSAFYDVIKISKAPVIASHSCCRYFVPANERNINDEMIKTLAANGGVVQINFAGEYLVNEIYEKRKAIDEEIKNYFDINNIDPRSSEGREYSRKYREENPIRKASVSDVADHIDHVVRIAGIDYVGIGSDYYGVGEDLPEGLEDASKIPNLIYELLRRGYSDEDIEKICGGNFLRVWKAVEKKSGS
jgi:membrane dipeptidase